jgi:signal transduction histidine kinase/ligand-binding sensor domain-containing protein/DNA-binding response OmpR family regulator
MRSIILLFLLIALNSNGQYFEERESSFQKLNVENGLSHNFINCILRDKTGFVWFGTRNGLNRFDGKKVSILEKEFDPKTNFKDATITCLIEDLNGIIWIGSDQGLIKYDPVYEKIERLSLDVGTGKPPSILCFEQEDDVNLWIGTSEGFLLFNRKSGSLLESIRIKPFRHISTTDNSAATICNIKGELWIGTSAGIIKWNKAKRFFSQCAYFDNQMTEGGVGIRKIIKDSEGNIWVGTEEGGLTCYNPVTNKYKTFNTENSRLPHNDVKDIFNLGNQKLWLATNGGGISLFDTHLLTFENYSYNTSNIKGLTSNSCYCIYQDYEGILWTGSYSGGINYNSSSKNNFKVTSHLPGNINSLCEDNARSLYLDSKNNLWIGTLGGLSVYDSKLKQFHAYISNPSDKNSLSFNKVTTVIEDIEKNIWIGTYSGGVNVLNQNGKNFLHYRYNSADPHSLSSNNVFCIVEDSLRNIWVATGAGLDLFDKKNNRWQRKNSLNTRDICLMPSGKLLLATQDGLAEYDTKTDSLKSYFFSEVSGSPLIVFCKDSQDKVWFGTQGSGFGSYDIQTKKIRIFKTTDGLPSNFISSIVNYDDKYLWISTYKGISLFDKENLLFVNYGLADGLPFLGFHPRSSVILPNQNIAFGGSDGVVYFDPKKIISEINKSNIRFSSLKIAGKQVSIGEKSLINKNLNSIDELNLNYDQNDFSIEFIDLNFINREYDQYVFKLENYMDEWRNVETQNIIGFTNMSPGQYILRIKNQKSTLFLKNQQEVRLIINIIPPFWKRWYFYGLQFLMIIGLLLLYSKYTLISINKKNEIRLKNLEYEKHEEFNQLRIRFFTYISHELRTPLTLIVDPINKLLQMTKEKESYRYLKLIDKNSNRLLRLVDQILDFRKLENDTLKLSVSKRNISQLVSDISNSFDEIARTERINYVFENQLSTSIEGWIDSDTLEKIMYNLLSNAFKFTKEKGEVSIRLSLDASGQKIEIVVQDNGYGIEKDQLQHIFDLFYSDEKQARYYRGSVGVGLSFVKRLIDLHHGTIQVDSEINKGTSFIITLPIDKKSYSQEEESQYLIVQEEKTTPPLIDSLEVSEEWNIKKHGNEVPLILLVEDETDLRRYVASRLSCRFRILEACNGKEALVLAEKHSPDLILCDNIMPEMDGIKFCNEIKSRKNLNLIPFVFLSAWTSDDFKLEGLKSGADDYISKPFNFDILETKISNIIHNRKIYLEIARRMIKVEPNDHKIKTIDEQFILKAQSIIERNLDNSDFSTKNFEDELNMSHSAVYRKLKELTGLAANEFIREYKLRRAAQILIQDKNLTIFEVCQMVGISDAKYFSHCFKKLFGDTPSDYLRKNSPLINTEFRVVQ